MQSYPSLKRKEQGSTVKPGQSSEKTGHEPTAFKVQMDFIDSKTEENDELTSIMTWNKCGPKYCQLVREANLVSQLVFAQHALNCEESLNDDIFTDESTTWLEHHREIFFREKGEAQRWSQGAKIPLKSMFGL